MATLKRSPVAIGPSYPPRGGPVTTMGRRRHDTTGSIAGDNAAIVGGLGFTIKQNTNTLDNPQTQGFNKAAQPSGFDLGDKKR